MTTEYRHGESHVYRHIAGEHLLIDLGSRSEIPYYALTQTGALLWEKLGDWSAPDQLASHLQSRYDIPMEKAIADVTEFLDQLESIGAVQQR